jgi:hypothetical protein
MERTHNPDSSTSTTRLSALLFCLILCASGQAVALTCPGGIISKGEQLSVVHIKCGDPTYWEQRTEQFRIINRLGGAVERSRTVEEWTYDLGPKRLVRSLTFHDGRLVKIQSGGYGALGSRTTGDRPGLVSVGDSKAAVILRWGEPSFIEKYKKVRTLAGRRGTRVEKTVIVDVLTYNFGPQRLIRLLTFEDGRLMRQRTGGVARSEARNDPPANDPQKGVCHVANGDGRVSDGLVRLGSRLWMERRV